jgi:ribosomal-protein-alanine N-acetyltransferase
MLKVRPAKRKDIAACLSAQASEGNKYFSKKDYLNSIKNPYGIFLVAELDGKVVGYVISFIVPTKHSEAIVHSTMVNKKFRRQNIGCKLVKSFVKVAFGKGVKQIFAMVEKGYPYKFYKSCGFKKTAFWYELSVKK